MILLHGTIDRNERANAVAMDGGACRTITLFFRANQEQQSRMPPPNTTLSGVGGVIGNTPFIQPLSTPSTGFRTRELHGLGYFHIGSPADQGYAEHMSAILILTKDGRTDPDKVSRPFKAVELFRLAE